MENLFYKMGRKVGSSIKKGKWYYKSAFGSEEEAIKAEMAVGKELALNMIKDTKVINNQDFQNVIDEIGIKLYEKVVNKKRKFKFYIIAGSDINAFALPGGLIFITDKLFRQINQNKHELAFVLAHEMMHVVFKHPMNKILADYSTRIVSNILIKGGTLGALAKQMLSNLLKSSYSQDKEFEADEYAVRLMYSTGFNPNDAKNILNKLKRDSEENMPGYNYFTSHPPIDERICRINKIIKDRKMKTMLS